MSRRRSWTREELTEIWRNARVRAYRFQMIVRYEEGYSRSGRRLRGWPVGG